MPDDPTTSVRSPDVLRYADGVASLVSDELAHEEPLEIRVRGRAISVTMRTPGHDSLLAAGFLLSEGLVRRRSDILRIVPCGRNEEENVLNVVLAPEVHVDFNSLTRHVFASSSCGLCGKATIEAIRANFPRVESNFSIAAEDLLRFPEIMRQSQATFERTGGLHAAALFDEQARLLAVHEDVGRHNAVDKVLGHAFLEDLLPLDRHVLVVSGRLSFEIMQKALAVGLPVVAAVSAPSSLAVEFAKESGQTLVGFIRNGRMNIYAGSQRVRFPMKAGEPHD